MQTKMCSKCGIEKPLSDFHKDKRDRSGVRSICKLCRKKYCEENKERINQYNKQYYQENKEKLNTIKRQYYLDNKDYYEQYRIENKDYFKQYFKQYQINNRDKVNGISAKRRATKLKATPELTQEEQELINKYYILCNFLGTDKYHIDHIIPLANGGLHHPDNLQVLTAEDNFSKGAKLYYEYKHPRISLGHANDS